MKHNSILNYRFRNIPQVHTVKFKVFEDLDTIFTIKHGCFFHPTAFDYAVISKEITS